jgi:hypothetical protein
MTRIDLGIGLFLLAAIGDLLAQPVPKPTETPSLDVLPGIRVVVPPLWVRSPLKYRDAIELLRWSEAKPPEQLARTLIFTEHRRDHREAVQRLAEITAGPNNAALQFFTIAGWPAAERWYLAPMPKRLAENDVRTTDDRAFWLTTAIAYGNDVVRFETTVVPHADPKLADEARSIHHSVQLGQANEEQTNEDLAALREGSIYSSLAKHIESGLNMSPTTTATMRGAPRAVGVLPAGSGELQVAASGNGTSVVVATNSKTLSLSTNSGATFSPSALGFGFPTIGDPSVAWGKSNVFYVGVIGAPNGSTAAGGVTGCSASVSASANLTAGFAFRAHAAFCTATGTPTCFADQPQIAADRFTTTTGGSDQVYAVWRNFLGTSCATAPFWSASVLACSSASGMSWTATPVFAGYGDFSRVAVGPDGFVYVVQLDGAVLEVNKFTSCSSGLAPVAGFPQALDVMDINPCPAGLDRCDETQLASPMIAVSDTDANHVFVAYAKRSSPVNDQILLIDSADGGLNWSRGALPVNLAVDARRFLPWVCVTDDSAWVSWYDRRSATSAAPDNTEYFLGGGFRRGGSWSVRPERDLSGGTADPQCATGFPCSASSVAGAEGCPTQPQLAGICSNWFGLPGGSGARCDFSTPACRGLEVCIVPSVAGCPKYGDYNGNGCAAGKIFTAWASATAPAGLTPLAGGTGIAVFADSFTPPTLLSISTFRRSGQGTFNIRLDGNTAASNVATSTIGPITVTPGNHVVSAVAAAGTTAGSNRITFSNDCNAAGSVTAVRGRGQLCSIMFESTTPTCADACRNALNHCVGGRTCHEDYTECVAECRHH